MIILIIFVTSRIAKLQKQFAKHYIKMKYLFCLFLFFQLHFICQAQTSSKPSKVRTSEGIHWLSLSDAQELMKVTPKKVYIDIYTDWCGWCKVMESKTFTNKNVIDYMNENYYAIHLNAEAADSLVFKGKKYGRVEGSKTNELIADWLHNKLSYPTSIFFDEMFVGPQPVPGYLDVPTIEMILKYIATNKHKSVPFDKYKKEFKGTW